MAITGIILAFLAAGASPLRADPYRALARDLSSFAGRQSRRVAVLPFTHAGGAGDSAISLALSERLIVGLVREGRLEVLERTLLKRVLDEQGLGAEGLLDPRQARQLGNLLGVDAVITGTFLHLREDQLEVNARVIDTGSARILGAASARVPNEWKRSWDDGAGSLVIDPPNLGGFLETGFDPAINAFAESRAGDDGCSDWESKVDAVQDGAIELKARYWASRLREKGFSASRLRANPGSEIRSMAARQRFYNRTRELYDSGYAENLSPGDWSLLDQSDRKAKLLAQRCER